MQIARPSRTTSTVFVLVLFSCFVSLFFLPQYSDVVRAHMPSFGRKTRPVSGPLDLTWQGSHYPEAVKQAKQSDTTHNAPDAPHEPPATESDLDPEDHEIPPHYIFAFGDSFTATGFNIALAAPSRKNPFGNPPWPGASSAVGPNWIDKLITSSPPNTLCYNFATGAAVVDVAVVSPPLSLIPFPEQVDNFTTALDSGAGREKKEVPWTADNSLAVIWFGVNDMRAAQGHKSRATPATLVEMAMESMFQRVALLHDAGLRKFIFMGIPPLYRFPFALVPDLPYPHVKNLTFSCLYWNGALKKGIDGFKAVHQDAESGLDGVDAWFISTDGFFGDAIDDPGKYGAPNATCNHEDGRQCLFVDKLHPGVEIARLVGQGMRKVLSSIGFFGEDDTEPSLMEVEGEKYPPDACAFGNPLCADEEGNYPGKMTIVDGKLHTFYPEEEEDEWHAITTAAGGKEVANGTSAFEPYPKEEVEENGDESLLEGSPSRQAIKEVAGGAEGQNRTSAFEPYPQEGVEEDEDEPLLAGDTATASSVEDADQDSTFQPYSQEEEEEEEEEDEPANEEITRPP